MLVCPDGGAIDGDHGPGQVPFLVGAALQLLQQALPDAALLPAPEAGIASLPRAIALREVAPRRPGAQAPEDAIQNGPVIHVGPTAGAVLRR